jgi:arsenite/tail-anchored protein-transporting ATPase
MVTGKGGVGKTAVTAALAKAAHRAGKKVLVGEVTPDTTTTSQLLSHFGHPRVGDDPVEMAPNLYGVRICPTIGHKLFLRAALKINLLVDTAMKSAALTRFLSAAPAFPEIGTFYQLVSLLRLKRFDHLILDLPATGHAIGLVSLPKTVLKVLPPGLIGDAIKEGLEVITDPAKTGAIVVTLPEGLPVTESLELAEGLGRHGVAVRAMILNRMPAVPFSDLELAALDHHLAARDGSKLLLGTKELRKLERALRARETFREKAPVPTVEIDALEGATQTAVIDHLTNAIVAARIGGAP